MLARRLPLLAVLAVALALGVSACTQAVTKATVTFTSPGDNARITGARAITVTGTLAGSVTTFTAKLNGAAVAGASHSGTSFSLPVTLADQANTVTVTVTNSAGSTTATLHLTYPHLALTTFQAAGVVIGQPDFMTVGSHLTQSGLGGVYGNPAVVGGTFYLPDYGQDRVLGFLSGIPTSNGANADFVLGQPDFTTGTATAAADGMSGPQTVITAGGKLLIDDYSYNRVLVWNTPPTTTQAPADLAIGQSDLTSTGHACTGANLYDPESIATIGTKLLIADSDHNRVLIYNTIPTSSGAAADLVLGQNSLTTCTENDDNQDGSADATPTARTLYYPSDIWTDGTRLVVADYSNNRVLIWNTFPTANFQPADVVIGQGNFTTVTSNTGAAGLDEPYFLAGNGNQLFVADASNNRVLIFDGIPTANGAAASQVLGQSNFTNNTENDDNQDGSADATPTARTLYYPAGLLLTDDALIVMDESNERALVFRP